MKDKSEIYIGVYNTCPEQGPIDFTIRLREYTQEATFNQDVAKLHRIFKHANQESDAEQVSIDERSRKDLREIRDFTFGEVIFANFVPVLAYVKPQPGEVFYDLGCATGLPLLIASLFHPELAACKGIEMLEDLVALGKEIS